jgi:hypothetical protein
MPPKKIKTPRNPPRASKDSGTSAIPPVTPADTALYAIAGFFNKATEFLQAIIEEHQEGKR